MGKNITTSISAGRVSGQSIKKLLNSTVTTSDAHISLSYSKASKSSPQGRLNFHLVSPNYDIAGQKLASLFLSGVLLTSKHKLTAEEFSSLAGRLTGETKTNSSDFPLLTVFSKSVNTPLPIFERCQISQINNAQGLPQGLTEQVIQFTQSLNSLRFFPYFINTTKLSVQQLRPIFNALFLEGAPQEVIPLDLVKSAFSTSSTKAQSTFDAHMVARKAPATLTHSLLSSISTALQLMKYLQTTPELPQQTIETLATVLQSVNSQLQRASTSIYDSYVSIIQSQRHEQLSKFLTSCSYATTAVNILYLASLITSIGAALSIILPVTGDSLPGQVSNFTQTQFALNQTVYNLDGLQQLHKAFQGIQGANFPQQLYSSTLIYQNPLLSEFTSSAVSGLAGPGIYQQLQTAQQATVTIMGSLGGSAAEAINNLPNSTETLRLGTESVVGILSEKLGLLLTPLLLLSKLYKSIILPIIFSILPFILRPLIDSLRSLGLVFTEQKVNKQVNEILIENIQAFELSVQAIQQSLQISEDEAVAIVLPGVPGAVTQSVLDRYSPAAQPVSIEEVIDDNTSDTAPLTQPNNRERPKSTTQDMPLEPPKSRNRITQFINGAKSTIQNAKDRGPAEPHHTILPPPADLTRVTTQSFMALEDNTQ